MRTILLMILVAVFSLNLLAQEIPVEENKSQNTEIIEEHFPTGAELVAHRRIVNLFVQNLLKTFYVEESLMDISVDDWSSRSALILFAGEELFDLETKSEVLHSSELSNFYVLISNYLLMSSLNENFFPEGHTQEQCVPLAVQRIFRQNSFMKQFIGESSEDTPQIGSLAKLKEMVVLTDYANKIYSQDLRANIEGNQERYKQKLARIINDGNENLPRIEVLSEPKFGMPKGSRIMTSNYYIFILHIAVIENQYKVIAAECNFGD